MHGSWVRLLVQPYIFICISFYLFIPPITTTKENPTWAFGNKIKTSEIYYFISLFANFTVLFKHEEYKNNLTNFFYM